MDPSGLAEALPAGTRGVWISGTPGNGVFEYGETPLNIQKNMVGLSVTFANGHIAVGGFPASAYYCGDPALATVNIETVLGTSADFAAADKQMRTKLGDPNWEQPKSITWNHAGEPGSTTLELVDYETHRSVKHKGNAAIVRSAPMVVNATLGVLNVYGTLKDAAEFAGAPSGKFTEGPHQDYYFAGLDGSVFTVTPQGLFSTGRRNYILGPKKGQSESLTCGQVNEYRKLGEELYGRYVPATWFLGNQPRFIPGTIRKTLPIMDPTGTTQWGTLGPDGPSYNRYYYSGTVFQ